MKHTRLQSPKELCGEGEGEGRERGREDGGKGEINFGQATHLSGNPRGGGEGERMRGGGEESN